MCLLSWGKGLRGCEVKKLSAEACCKAMVCGRRPLLPRRVDLHRHSRAASFLLLFTREGVRRLPTATTEVFAAIGQLVRGSWTATAFLSVSPPAQHRHGLTPGGSQHWKAMPGCGACDLSAHRASLVNIVHQRRGIGCLIIFGLKISKH